MRHLEEGNLVVPNYDRSVENAKKIMLVKQFYDGFSRPVFVRTMVSLFKNENYNHSQFIERLKSNPDQLKHCISVLQTKTMIEDIYNTRSREKVSLRFSK